jgi:branched-chain amino acid transport system substrate-binding protein
VEAARFLIHREEVAAIVGPQLSRNAIPAAQIAEETGIPMICPMSTSPLTTSGKSYGFRIPYLDGFQGTVMAYFARRELEARTAAVLFDVANVYNREIAEVFKDEFSSLGGRITAFERYTTDDNTDFSKQLSRIRQTAPDVLYLPNYAADVQRQAEQARSLGLESVLLGSDGWSDTMFQSEPAFNGSFMTRHWHPEISSPQSKQFFRAYSDRFGREPDDVAATTYDAFSLLFAAVELAGSSDPPEIQKNLYLLDEFQGVTGTIDYRENGDPVKSAIIIEIRDGENHFYSEVKPSSSMVDHG